LIKNFLDKDRKDWEDFISSEEKLYDKDSENIKKKNTKIRSIDLHGYTLENANKIIDEFIVQSFSEGIQKLKVVTGKGLHSQNEKNPYVSKDLSILRYSVPDFIKKNKKLMSIINGISEAKIEDGGSGAFYIYLKKNKNT
jgi:DNA-nicking Smr family endonuclease